MYKLQVGRLIYSNCAIRQDVAFGSNPAKYLGWRFWWDLR